MLHRRILALLIGTAIAFTACGSSDDAGSQEGSANVGDAVVAVGAAPVPADVTGDGVGSLGDAVEVAAAAPGEADTAACALDRQTLETAIEAYELLNGAAPTDLDDLVAQQLLREPSTLFVIGPDGTLAPTAGGPCT